MRKPTVYLICMLAAGAIPSAHADEFLGAYVGAAVGRGIVKADLQVLPLNSPVRFDESRTAFSAILGIRPIRHLGAEVGYVDFGHNSAHDDEQ